MCFAITDKPKGKQELKNLKSTKFSKILKSSYMKTIILAIILLVGVFAFWFGLKITLQTEFPLLAVASGSMIPTLNVGDLIVVQGISDASEINAAPYPEGDIIVFHKPGFENELIVHRAISKYQGNDGTWYFQTKGDNNSGADPWRVSEKLLVGKVVGKVPWLGHIPLFMRTPPGILIVILLFVILIIADFIFPQKEKGQTESQKDL